MKVSVITPTWRPGGIDISFAGMANQTYKDFEYILVDFRYQKRHKEVMALAKEMEIPLVHVPEHRRNGKWAVVASAYNTGFMLAEGEIIIVLADYSYAPPGWIEAHLSYHDGSDKVAMGHYMVRNVPQGVDKEGNPVEMIDPHDVKKWLDHEQIITEPLPEIYGEITVFKEPLNAETIMQLTPMGPPHECPRLTMRLDDPNLKTAMHLKNESFPLELALRTGGCDEHLDIGKYGIDIEIGQRFAAAGASFEIAPTATVYQPNPRGFLRGLPHGSYGEEIEDRWDEKGCMRYIDARMGQWGIESPVAKNPYNMREKRAELLKWKEMDFIPVEDLEIPDAEYFKDTGYYRLESPLRS